MKIAITGAQGVGKTTLANQFVRGRFFVLLPEAARLAADAGFKLDRTATAETEIWIAHKQKQLELNGGSTWIADRCFVDLLAYCRVLFAKNLSLLHYIEDMAHKRIEKYDIIAYCPAGQFPIQSDGLRYVNTEFQMSADKEVRRILADYKTKTHLIVGSEHQRLKLLTKIYETKLHEQRMQGSRKDQQKAPARA